MSGAERVAGAIGTALMVALLYALVRKGHWRTLPVFTAFVACMIATQAPIAVDHQRFYRQDFWLFHETATAALRFGVALELSHRIFRGFPGAAASALNAVLAIVAITSVAVVGMYSPNASYERIMTELVPGIAHGTAWIFTIIAVLALWYRIPLAPLPKGILMSYTPYLLIFTLGRGALADSGLDTRFPIGWLVVLCFHVVKGYWIWVAWFHPATEPVPMAVLVEASGRPRVA